MLIAYAPGQRPIITPLCHLPVVSVVHWRSRHVVVEEIANLNRSRFNMPDRWYGGRFLNTVEGVIAVFHMSDGGFPPFMNPPVLTVRVPLSRSVFRCPRCERVLNAHKMKWEGYEIFYCEDCDERDAVVEFSDYYGVPPAASDEYHIIPDDHWDDIPF